MSNSIMLEISKGNKTIRFKKSDSFRTGGFELKGKVIVERITTLPLSNVELRKLRKLRR